ncbi:MAG: glucuronyl hydrolase [Luteolibacter sp.]
MNPLRHGIDIDRVMRAAARKLAKFDESQPVKNVYPNDAKGAEWTTVAAHDWESGFYPGALWYLYEYARLANWPDAADWRARAEIWTAGLESQQFNNTHHDTGFVIFDSYGNGHRITGNAAYRPIILRTAESLASRYCKETGMIRSWGEIGDREQFIVIMDNMMNLELLVWASENGGPEELREIAISHADRTLELFFRPDGGTCHAIELDPANGNLRRRFTAQGKADDSTWSRGQAWAIYGFSYMHEATGDPRYLAAALTAADYFLVRLPQDQLPPSDFDSNLIGVEFKDSSAAAIVASALLRIYQLVETPELKERYFEAAESMLQALTLPPYFSEGDDRASLLLYSARNYHPDPDHRLTNTSLIWSDYYFLETVLCYHQHALSRSASVGAETHFQSASSAHP